MLGGPARGGGSSGRGTGDRDGGGHSINHRSHSAKKFVRQHHAACGRNEQFGRSSRALAYDIRLPSRDRSATLSELSHQTPATPTAKHFGPDDPRDARIAGDFRRGFTNVSYGRRDLLDSLHRVLHRRRHVSYSLRDERSLIAGRGHRLCQFVERLQQSYGRLINQAKPLWAGQNRKSVNFLSRETVQT